MIKVAKIRSDNIRITNESIVYYWWFKINCFQHLLHKLNEEINFERILVKEINNEPFGLLYIGKGKDGNQRLVKYHILDTQNYHLTGVENKRLSSLRQTLCGLLDLHMSNSKNEINNFMDENCMVEFDIINEGELNAHENSLIRSNYLPLNSQNTKGVLTENHRRILAQSKNSMRQ